MAALDFYDLLKQKENPEENASSDSDMLKKYLLSKGGGAQPVIEPLATTPPAKDVHPQINAQKTDAPPPREFSSEPVASDEKMAPPPKAAVSDENMLSNYLLDKYKKDDAKNEQSVTDLKRAQANALMMEGFNNIGSGIAHVTPDNSDYKDQVKGAQNVADLQTKQTGQTEALSKAIEMQGTAKLKLDQQKQTAADKNALIKMAWDQRNQDREDRLDRRDDELADKKGAKLTTDQGKADSELGAKLSTLGGRGLNKNYGESLRRANNIKDLLNRYPNLDDMPESQVALATAEMDGMVNGGAPTIAGVGEMRTKTLMSEWQKLMSNAKNKPTGAQLGAFLKEYQPYVNDIGATAKKYLKGQNKNLVESYKSRLPGDAYQRYQTQVESDYPEEKSTDQQKPAYDPSTQKLLQKVVNGAIQYKVVPR